MAIGADHATHAPASDPALRAAIYARRSHEQGALAEEAKSITRQIAHAREYAARKAWRVLETCIYIDEESGAEFDERRRPGLAQLLNAVRATPSPFDVLVMMEGSRLGRESIETLYVLKRIIATGVRVFHYLDDRERTLNDPMERLHAQVLAFTDEMERERARQRTKDALLRRARAGHVTGGLVFGYDNRPVVDAVGRRSHVERVVNEAEGAVVRRIFELSAAGYGLRTIAIMLNDDTAPAPTPRQLGRPRGWAPSSVREVLYRDLYRGVLRWNKTRKRDQWGRKRQSDRPESEWVETPIPALRIVSDELWHRAHERLRGVREGYQRATGGVMHVRPLNGVESKYLLTGFATCGQCGGSLHVRSRKSGGSRLHVYGCSVSFYRGRSICSNRALLPLEATETALLDTIAAQVLHPEVIRRALRLAEAKLTAPASVDRKALRDELHRVEGQLGNLTTAITLGGTCRRWSTSYAA